MNGLSPSPPARSPSPWRWWVCVLLLLASTLNYMDRLTLNQTSPRIKDAFGIDNFWYSVLESVFTVGFALGTLATGVLVDRVGVRRVYPVVVLGWSAFGFLTGFAPGYWALFACRLGLGLFEAGNWPCGVRTVRQIMAPSERSLGNAFFQNGTALGAIVTPGIVILCLLWADPGEAARQAHLAAGGGGATAAAGTGPEHVWQVPFRAIGLLGLAWVALWVLSVPARALRPVVEDPPAAAAAPFSAVLADRRFWLLLAVVVAVNTSWHTVRVWLPLFLRKQQGYTEIEMGELTTLYYIAADAGSWAVGLGSLLLARLGMTVHRSRVALFAACTAVVLAGLALPHLDRGPAQVALLLAFGFGAFGLFPTYFALSQELSASHQGKVTGALGFLNALYLTALFPLEGRIADATGRYDQVMSVAGLPALLALVAVLWWWPRDTVDRHSA